MSPAVRKLALTVHLTCSVGWAGAVVAYLALDAAARGGGDPATVRAAWTGMELTGWFAIVPLAASSLVTGIVMSLGTPWGIFRHYWVLISLGLTVVSVAVLVSHMPDVSAIARSVREANDADLHGAGRGDLLHAGGGLVVLLVITVLNVYKPRGMTPYGWRHRFDRGQDQSRR
jgi:hypothetical protein